jgi:hypothetical protein
VRVLLAALCGALFLFAAAPAAHAEQADAQAGQDAGCSLFIGVKTGCVRAIDVGKVALSFASGQRGAALTTFNACVACRRAPNVGRLALHFASGQRGMDVGAHAAPCDWGYLDRADDGPTRPPDDGVNRRRYASTAAI